MCLENRHPESSWENEELGGGQFRLVMLGIRYSHFLFSFSPSFILKVNGILLLFAAVLGVTAGQPTICSVWVLSGSHGLFSFGSCPPLAFTGIIVGPDTWGSSWNYSALTSSPAGSPTSEPTPQGNMERSRKINIESFSVSSHNISELLCYISEDIFSFFWTSASQLNFNNTYMYFFSVNGEDLRSDYQTWSLMLLHMN